MNRVIGFGLVGLAVAVCLLAGAFLGLGMAGKQLSGPGAVLGFGLVLVIVVAPLGIGGVVVLRQVGRREKDDRDSARLRKILDVVQTQGSVKVSDLAIELKSDLPSVRDMVYRLVGMGVFTGYVNWDEGVLYSADAAGMRNLTECKNCGGKLTLAGKGVVKCPYCGTEYFLS